MKYTIEKVDELTKEIMGEIYRRLDKLQNQRVDDSKKDEIEENVAGVVALLYDGDLGECGVLEPVVSDGKVVFMWDVGPEHDDFTPADLKEALQSREIGICEMTLLRMLLEIEQIIS